MDDALFTPAASYFVSRANVVCLLGVAIEPVHHFFLLFFFFFLILVQADCRTGSGVCTASER